MSPRKPRRGSNSARELIASLHDDRDYQARFQREEAERQTRSQELRKAEEPIVNDLRNVGVEIASVWDLVNTAEPYPLALPVLMSHFERGGYPDRVMNSLGRALAVAPSIKFWERLKACYLSPRNTGEEDGAAVALAACATPDQLDDMVQFLSLSDRGTSRIYFVRPVLRLGGRRGRSVVGSLLSDEVLGKEARALLKPPSHAP